MAYEGDIDMKKKVGRIISLVLVILVLMSNNIWAQELPQSGDNYESNLSDPIQPRSLYLASGISEITNEGEGVLRIYADFASYESVPWASLTITLQRKKDASSGSWSTVKTYTYEFDEDDYNGDLTYAGTEFYVRGMTTNYYYRVKCVHKVKTPSGSYESKTSQTSGVLLTSYPEFRSLDEVK